MKIGSGFFTLSLSLYLCACTPGATPVTPPETVPTTAPETPAATANPGESSPPVVNPTSAPSTSPSPATPTCGDVVSTFSTDTEGWIVAGDAEGGTGNPDYQSAEGNPGGHLSADDDVTGGTWYWSAPQKFLGNQKAALNQKLSFDLKQSDTSAQFENSDVVLEGNGMTLVLQLEAHPGTDWTAYTVMLNTSSAWKKDSAEGEVATLADIESVLSDLTRLWIRGEYIEGSDTGSLDNVRLSQLCPNTGLPKSTFDTDSEGWLVAGDAEEGTGTPDYQATNGNPGGHLSADDDVTGGTWYWSAPQKFLGNQASAYQKTLAFDLKQSTLSSQFEDSDVILEGNGKTLSLSLNRHPGLDWTSYSVNLDTRAAWKLNDSDGALASATDIQNVLQDLSRLWIRGEYVEGEDTGALDNVILGQ
jgi:hypothetical protein